MNASWQGHEHSNVSPAGVAIVLSVTGLTKSYPAQAGPREVLHDLSFTLGREETLSIVGPSGCGKTTLLYLLCGMIQPDRGKVTLEGEQVGAPSADIAIVLQEYGLLPWKTVEENVALGLKLAGVSQQKRRKRAGTLLFELGLSGREKDYPACLSGGERQRVAIARAYAMDPKLLLMDEPFSSLDAITREKLQDTLVATWQRSHVPYVLVTHSVDEAVFLGRHVVVLAGSPATIKARFENPGFGSHRFRESKSYFHLIRQIRRTMEASW
ncbi:MAG: ABC transporter ATP-binding protein [Desulfovibrionales bacterium]